MRADSDVHVEDINVWSIRVRGILCSYLVTHNRNRHNYSMVVRLIRALILYGIVQDVIVSDTRNILCIDYEQDLLSAIFGLCGAVLHSF